MGTKFYGRSEEVAERVFEVFRSGNLPKALAPIFITRNDSIPSASWSWSNKLIQALAGTCDSRGFHQWKAVGRGVKAGARAFYILAPCIWQRNIEDDDGNIRVIQQVHGFKSIPVFAIEATEVVDSEKWMKSIQKDRDEILRLEALPLIEVARHWGLSVDSYTGKNSRYLGYYIPSQKIALGVKNLSTWCHELIHAADDRLGNLPKLGKGDTDCEIVAEIGGAVLLELMGNHVDADLGGAWDYIKRYSGNDSGKAIRECMRLINRICACVNLIIETQSQMDNYEIMKAS
jgi:hypothetical protein